jgi:signal transduction histidine kinase
LKIADWLTVFCISAGAVIMLLSVLKTAKLRKMIVAGVNTLRWKWLGRFMIIFLVGYVLAVFLIILGFPEPLLLITGLVFLLGSFFVYLVVHSAKDDIRKIFEANELLLRKNTELRKINLELDQFAYRTSHDLKAPVTSLKGLIKVAELSSSREEITRCHEMMKERLHSLEELIRGILDLSKNARTEVDYVPLRIHDAIWQLIRGQTMDGNRVQVAVEGDENFYIHTDPTRLKMIIGNLLSNALHYTDHAKPSPFVMIRYWKNEGQFCISVKDNGVGIEEQYQQRIFDMFFRVSETSIGSGLGLYIVRESAEKLKGSVKVISERGIGSEFIVNLPVITPDQA